MDLVRLHEWRERMEYLSLFFTHSGAIKFKRNFDSTGGNCELMPVPRKLSSNCGICAKFSTDCINEQIDEDVEKVYKISGDSYELIYDDE